MGFQIEINSLLVIPAGTINYEDFVEGSSYGLSKDGQRIYPVNVPIEFCDENYKYLGKVLVRSLTIKHDQTELEFEVVKMFSAEDSRVFSDNFIKPE